MCRRISSLFDTVAFGRMFTSALDGGIFEGGVWGLHANVAPGEASSGIRWRGQSIFQIE